jgi:hypothetical protein
MTHRFVTPLVAACAVLLFGACGSDATAPQSGHASAVVTDDPGGAAPATRVVRSSDAAPTADRSATAQTVDGGSTFSGSMTATMQVAISADGQSWVNVGAPVTNSLQLQTAGDSTTIASQTSVPVGTYAYVRLVLQGTNAQVSGSLAGIAFTNAALSIGGGDQVVIEKHVSPFTVSASTDASIVFDVNSEVWVTAESAQSHTATAAELEAAATAVVR